jgi:hypothetical protein
MRTMVLAAAAALSLGIGSACAAGGQGQAGGYLYPDYIAPGSVYAGAPTPAQNSARVTTLRNGQATHIYGTHSQSQGIWLFPPDQAGGGN